LKNIFYTTDPIAWQSAQKKNYGKAYEKKNRRIYAVFTMSSSGAI